MVQNKVVCMPDGASSGAVSGHRESLPAWNLADLYDGVDSAALRNDLAESQSRAAAFRAAYAGKLEELSAAGLASALR
jgi:oligoendopeptidase F